MSVRTSLRLGSALLGLTLVAAACSGTRRHGRDRRDDRRRWPGFDRRNRPGSRRRSSHGRRGFGRADVRSGQPAQPGSRRRTPLRLSSPSAPGTGAAAPRPSRPGRARRSSPPPRPAACCRRSITCSTKWTASCRMPTPPPTTQESELDERPAFASPRAGHPCPGGRRPPGDRLVLVRLRSRPDDRHQLDDRRRRPPLLHP